MLYRDARKKIRHGDLVLFKSDSLISTAGRGHYSHAARAVWFRPVGSSGGTLLLAEARLLGGRRIVTFSSQVRKYPGAADVFRLRWSRPIIDLATEFAMRQCTGDGYGRLGILKCAAMHTPGVWYLAQRLCDPTDTTLSSWESHKFCSQLVCWCDRKACRALDTKMDPVPGLADWACEPEDLEHSGSYEKTDLLGLVHDEPQKTA